MEKKGTRALLARQNCANKLDAAEKRFVYQVLDEMDKKNHSGNEKPDDSPGKGRIYERPESLYSPGKTFELYLSKLNPALSCLC